MTLPKLELQLSAEQAAESAKKFIAAVDAVASSTERMGGAADKAQDALDGVGKSTTDATAPLKRAGDGVAAFGKQVATGGAAAQAFEKRLGGLRSSTVAATNTQKVFADAGRGTAAVLRLLGDSPAATALANVTSAFASATSASRAFGGIIGSLPLGTVAALAGTAVAAFFAFGDSVSSTSVNLRKMIDDAREAEGAARRLDRLREDIIVRGDARAGQQLIEDLQGRVVRINELMRLGETSVPADDVLSSIKTRAPETIAALEAVMATMKRFGDEGKEAPADVRRRFDELANTVDERFGVRIRAAGENVDGFFAAFSGVKGRTAVKTFAVDAGQAARAVGIAFDLVRGKARAAIEAIAESNKRREDLRLGVLPQEAPKDNRNSARSEVMRTDAMQAFLALKVQEVALLGKSEEAQQRLRLVQEAMTVAEKAKRPIYVEEVAILASILAAREKIAAVTNEERRAKSVGEILAQLRRENELLEAQGAARQALQRSQEAEIALSRIKGGATKEERAALDELLASNKRLLEIEGMRTEQKREAKVAAKELAEAEKDAAAYGEEFGNHVGNALERLIIDGAKARDVMCQLADDLARQAFRATAGNALQQILGAAGAAFGNWLSGGSTPMAGPNSTTGQMGLTNSSSPSGGNFYNWNPQLTGGVIPAMGGQVIDEFAFMRRGGRNYSVSEGGATTPEAIFPLQRDQQGRLGVVGAGGGGDTINISLPGVRTQQEARAVRATIGQQLRQLRDADRRGRRGMRPRE